MQIKQVIIITLTVYFLLSCKSTDSIRKSTHSLEVKEVTGITSYRSTRTGCSGYVKTINWEDAPDYTVEVRNR